MSSVETGGELFDLTLDADDVADELLRPHPVSDEVLDSDELHVELVGDAAEVGDARHRPVVVHDLDEHADGREACKTG